MKFNVSFEYEHKYIPPGKRKERVAILTGSAECELKELTDQEAPIAFITHVHSWSDEATIDQFFRWYDGRLWSDRDDRNRLHEKYVYTPSFSYRADKSFEDRLEEIHGWENNRFLVDGRIWLPESEPMWCINLYGDFPKRYVDISIRDSVWGDHGWVFYFRLDQYDLVQKMAEKIAFTDPEIEPMRIQQRDQLDLYMPEVLKCDPERENSDKWGQKWAIKIRLQLTGRDKEIEAEMISRFWSFMANPTFGCPSRRQAEEFVEWMEKMPYFYSSKIREWMADTVKNIYPLMTAYQTRDQTSLIRDLFVKMIREALEED